MKWPIGAGFSELPFPARFAVQGFGCLLDGLAAYWVDVPARRG
jgi:hypothetical protein